MQNRIALLWVIATKGISTQYPKINLEIEGIFGFRSPGIFHNPFYRWQNGPKAVRFAKFILKYKQWAPKSDVEYALGVMDRYNKQQEAEAELLRKKLEFEEKMKHTTTTTMNPIDQDFILRI